MATNITQIAKYLDNLGWDYRFDEEEDRIITGVEAENIEDFLIVVQLYFTRSQLEFFQKSEI
jgi:hypothetical protein